MPNRSRSITECRQSWLNFSNLVTQAIALRQNRTSGDRLGTVHGACSTQGGSRRWPRGTSKRLTEAMPGWMVR